MDKAVISKAGVNGAAAVVLRAGVYFLKDTLTVETKHSNIKVTDFVQPRPDTSPNQFENPKPTLLSPTKGDEFSWRKSLGVRRDADHTLVVKGH